MLDPDRSDWIEEIKRSIADLDRYRLKAEASGCYDMANRLKDQIGELDRRVKELQRTDPRRRRRLPRSCDRPSGALKSDLSTKDEAARQLHYHPSNGAVNPVRDVVG
jgi:hypothetical protein